MTPFTALSFNAFLFALGAIIGSFLNVVSIRYNGRGKLFNLKIIGGPSFASADADALANKKASKGKRSHCPYCGKALRWYELIPIVSFIVQMGKCNHCGRRISLQYPLVELASGFALLLPVYFYNYFGIFQKTLVGEPVAQFYVIAVIWTLAALAMILLSAIDWRLQIIPDQINLFIASLGLFTIVFQAESFLKNYAAIFGGPAGPLPNHLMAGIISLLFFGFIIVASQGKAMGMGDMKLAGALGLLLGWPDILLAVSLAFMIGSMWGIVLLAAGVKGLKENVPFGPFLVMGVLLTLFFGHSLMSWYFTLVL